MYRVAPFGNLRINLYVPIPVAYRSLSRPSSPPRAKASTVCPYLFLRLTYFQHCYQKARRLYTNLLYMLYVVFSFVFIKYVNDR